MLVCRAMRPPVTFGPRAVTFGSPKRSGLPAQGKAFSQVCQGVDTTTSKMGVLAHFRAYIHDESVHIGDRTQDGGVHAISALDRKGVFQ
jgi:hypothetical protein